MTTTAYGEAFSTLHLENDANRKQVAQYSYLCGPFNSYCIKRDVYEEWLTKPIVYCALPTTTIECALQLPSGMSLVSVLFYTMPILLLHELIHRHMCN